LRFAARHEKDNYREAAACARNALAAGKTVWWNADTSAAIYYHLPTARNGAVPGQAQWVVNPLRETLAAAASPDVVIASRPDVFDRTGALAEFLAQAHYQLVSNLTAFKIWVKPFANPAGPN